jgi:hypothetical protein
MRRMFGKACFPGFGLAKLFAEEEENKQKRR